MEHKFGTWCLIEELEDFEKDVLFLNGNIIEIGFMRKNSLGYISYRRPDNFGSTQIYPSKWTPLPPRPDGKYVVSEVSGMEEKTLEDKFIEILGRSKVVGYPDLFVTMLTQIAKDHYKGKNEIQN